MQKFKPLLERVCKNFKSVFLIHKSDTKQIYTFYFLHQKDKLI
jgi:hypothetical protein